MIHKPIKRFFCGSLLDKVMFLTQDNLILKTEGRIDPLLLLWDIEEYVK